MEPTLCGEEDRQADRSRMCCQALTGVMQDPDREGSASEHGVSLQQLVIVGGSSQEGPECEQVCEGSKGESQGTAGETEEIQSPEGPK